MKITETALMARINRRLAHGAERLRKCRPNSRHYSDLGDYYLLDGHNNITGPHIESLESYGRDLGVLRAGETLAAA
jgi:hypothetical protein